MKPNVKLALSYVGYTCPVLDELGKDYMSNLSLTKDQKETFLEFIEQIKKKTLHVLCVQHLNLLVNELSN